MSITDYLPRLGLLDRHGKHRAVDEVERLRGEVARVRGLLNGAHALIAGLQMREAETSGKQAEAEELVVQLQADVDDLRVERDELRDQLAAMCVRFGPQLAEEANATAITVPPMERDTTDPADQATTPIDVRPLWDALGIGPVTDPGRIS